MFRLQIGQTLQKNVSGPGIFTRELVQILSKQYGIEIVNKNPDIILTGIEKADTKTKAKTVFRVDGCYYDRSSSGFKGYNKGISRSIQNCSAVIYQSQFSKDLTTKLLGCSNDNHIIIYNGFNQELIKTVKPFDRPAEHVFIAAAKWRRTKRPESIINGFLEASIPNAKLVMIGYDQKIRDSRIICTPFIGRQEMYRWYKTADYLLHFCFLDSCSNTVVEALSFGLPVICNNTGGTCELVKNDGIIVNCDKYDFNYLDHVYDNVDPILVAEGINTALKTKFSVNRPDLDLKVCADRYLKFLVNILEK